MSTKKTTAPKDGRLMKMPDCQNTTPAYPLLLFHKAEVLDVNRLLLCNTALH